MAAESHGTDYRCLCENNDYNHHTPNDACLLIPGKPMGGQIFVSTYYITIKWQVPAEGNDTITAYIVRYSFKEKLCQDGVTAEGEEQTRVLYLYPGMYPPTELTVNDSIYPFWNYTFTVTANTTVGEGRPYQFDTIQTKESKPSQIDTVTVKSDVTAYAVKISWQPPCFPNGILTKYKVCLTNESMNAYQLYTCFDYNSDIMEATVNVLPYRNYTVKVSAETSAGPGQFSHKTYFETPIAAPAKPYGLYTIHTATDITVKWAIPAPEMFTGPTKYRVIAVDTVNDSVYTCETNIATWIDSLANNCTITSLHPYTNYIYNVTAITEKDNLRFTKVWSPLTTIITGESTPGDVTGLTIKAESDVTKPRTILVSWSKPAYRDIHGIIIDYFVQYTYVNGITLTSKTDNKATDFLMTNIQPGNYNIKVFAATRVGNGTKVSASTTLGPGAPIKMIESSGTLLMQRAYTSVSDDQKQIAVKLPLSQFLCNRSNGEPTKWGVIVSQENEAIDPPFVGSLSEFQSKIKPQYKNWFDVKDSDSIQPYIATRENWKPNCPRHNGRRHRRSTDSATINDYVIGAEGQCSEISHDKYCNGELQPGRKYKVKTFVCTSGGCTETEYSEPMTTESSSSIVLVIVGVVSAIVVVALVAGLIVYFFIRRRRRKRTNGQNSTSGDEAEQTGPYMELDVVTRVDDYDTIMGNSNGNSRNTYLGLDKTQADVHVYEQADQVHSNGRDMPGDRLSNIMHTVYKKLARILERPTQETNEETGWMYMLDNCDLNINRKEYRKIEESNEPGITFLDLLDEKGYTKTYMEHLFIDLKMKDALTALQT